MGTARANMRNLLALVAALLIVAPCVFSAPVATRRALFFAEQRAGRVGYILWPPVPCTTNDDCKNIVGSYCMNDKTKTAPYSCYAPPTYVAKGLAKPTGLAVDSTNSEVFFTEDDQTSGDKYHPLSEVKMGGTGKRSVLPKLLDPQGIAVDVANEKVYYTEHHGQRVGVVNYDGSSQKVLHQFDGTDYPADVKFDTKNNKVFTLVGGTSSTDNKLVSMDLDGSNVQVLKNDIVRAYGLTLDVENKKIYYINGGHGGFIGNVTYDGKDSGVVLDGLDWPYMLDYDAPRQLLVYSTTGVGDGVIRTVSTDGLKQNVTLTLGFAPMGVGFGLVPDKH